MSELSALEQTCKYCRFLWRMPDPDFEHPDDPHPNAAIHMADDTWCQKGNGGQDRYLCRHPRMSHINSDTSDRIVGLNDGVDCPYWEQNPIDLPEDEEQTNE